MTVLQVYYQEIEKLNFWEKLGYSRNDIKQLRKQVGLQFKKSQKICRHKMQHRYANTWVCEKCSWWIEK